ncbi:MAG TPA: zinc-binding dehydrogenase [Kofleriaceae bacterium]|jgi:NADPH:quinone reductase-like Zn-dependent oxidoreductase|nr:zinc-binding dehydrogenase [Kofleriaceae bacterium]
MKQIWITRAGAPDVLEVREANDPVPGPGEIRIRVHAAGINFADLMARIGLYPDAPKPPCVVGYEVSGVIDAVGSGVTRWAPGDRVFGMPRFGGYTDTLVISEAQAFRMPAEMTFEQAAALPVVYLTAHHMMLFTGNLRRRSRVLIHSAAGGVGLAAIEIARTRDCEVFGIASRAKHDFLRARGCQHPIDSGGDYIAAVKEATGGKGVDLVLDPVGGKSWSEATRCSRRRAGWSRSGYRRQPRGPSGTSSMPRCSSCGSSGSARAS